MKKKIKDNPKVTLLYKTDDGEYRIELPEGSRFTFGPAIPFERKNQYAPTRMEYAIRLYRDSSNESLMAVISGVHWVRDMSLPVSKLVVRESGKSVWKSDETGYEVQQSVQKDASWKDASTMKLLNE